MAKWVITKHDGLTEISAWELPGALTAPEVDEITRRLLC